MEFENTQQSPEEIEERERLEKEKLEELKTSLEGYHPVRIDWHVARILQERSIMTIEDPRGPLEIVSRMGLGAFLLAALTLEGEGQA